MERQWCSDDGGSQARMKFVQRGIRVDLYPKQ